MLAEDRYLPDSFAMRGRRLVYTQGIILLFAIGALLAFTMSQAGMVAWLTVLVLPALVLGFMRTNAHYRDVAVQIATSEPLEIEAPQAPIVVVAAQSWNKLTVEGLQFAIRVSPIVYAVQVKSETAKMRDLTHEWHDLVEVPARAAGLTPPKLVVLTSHYRQFFKPLVDFVIGLRDGTMSRDVVVVIPDLVVKRWYHAILHNHRGSILRALLRLRGGDRVIVVNTPFHLREA